MQRSYLIRIILFSVSALFIFLVSCSSKVTKLSRVQPDTYLSPKYEDKSFTNVSMDICYPIRDFNIPQEGADTAYIINLKEFDENFKKYFPDGIKTFSSFIQTGWIYYDMMKYYESGEIIEYHTKTKNGSDFYVFLPDSMSYFQSKSKSDFLLILHMGSVTLNPPDSSNPKSKYSTMLDHEYSIWDRKSGDLIAMDKVSAKMEFDRLAGKWPYRGAVMKTAALIFEKLPMFSK
jgi:hypothetical protein